MSEIEKAAKSSLVLLAGNEPALQLKFLDDLLARVGVSRQDFDVESVDANAVGPRDWVGSAATIPFMAERRVVVVRHLLRRDPKDADGSGLDRLPASALMILVADDENMEDQTMATRLRNWTAAVKAAKGFQYDSTLAGDKARSELRKIAEAGGVPMSGPACDLLLEMSGGKFSRAAEELDKLVLFCRGKKAIQESDVREIVVPSREWNVFAMIDGLIHNQVSAAVGQLRIMVGNKRKADAATFGQVLPQTGRALRLLWQARVCIEAGVSPGSATEAVRQAFPTRPNLANEKEFVQRKMMSAAQRVTLPKLAECFQIYADTDSRLKGALAAYDKHDTLELMLLEMAHALHRVKTA
ncbi:MAG: DNA polymerase III subunit delta [Fimbriimonadaceae bacterium]|nr:DNA polymerase III subunit delta [Fimbriimonadaceae bacterium]